MTPHMHTGQQNKLLVPKWLLLKGFNVTYGSKPLRKQVILQVFQFELNSGVHPIVQISSLKLPMDSPCKKDSSSKSVSVQNVREDFHIYFVRKGITLKCQNDVLCGNMNMDVSTNILKFKFFFKNASSTVTAWFHVGLLQSKNEMMCLPKNASQTFIHRNKTHIFQIFPVVISIRSKCIIIRKLKYVCS